VSEAEHTFFQGLLVAGFIVAVGTFILLLFVPAPYGRHNRKGWGPVIPARLGWLVMESVSPLVFLISFGWGRPSLPLPLIALVSVWTLHYSYRAFVFPFRIRSTAKKMPLLVAGSAIVFNSVNGYLNGRYLGVSDERYEAAYLSDPRFVVGMTLVVIGAWIHLNSDGILIRLRKPGETGYAIPKGGLYRWVSCPNYFGEVIEWIGFALAAWSLPGLYFAIWTAANLVPRALTHHRWYRETFEDYPRDRKALVPFLL
jgi:3-oxo-5-alpha-steroid 4-dehydrogenase 1